MAVAATHFEGPEKKLEVILFSPQFNIRNNNDGRWDKIVKASQADIISKKSTEHLDAYILSESSLFVWNDRAGKGGFDIWRSTRSSPAASWGKPEPIIPINSSGWEYSPWIEQATGVIYFESIRVNGEGGKDIYAWDPNAGDCTDSCWVLY